MAITLNEEIKDLKEYIRERRRATAKDEEIERAIRYRFDVAIRSAFAELEVEEDKIKEEEDK